MTIEKHDDRFGFSWMPSKPVVIGWSVVYPIALLCSAILCMAIFTPWLASRGFERVGLVDLATAAIGTLSIIQVGVLTATLAWLIGSSDGGENPTSAHHVGRAQWIRWKIVCLMTFALGVDILFAVTTAHFFDLAGWPTVGGFSQFIFGLVAAVIGLLTVSILISLAGGRFYCSAEAWRHINSERTKAHRARARAVGFLTLMIVGIALAVAWVFLRIDLVVEAGIFGAYLSLAAAVARFALLEHASTRVEVGPDLPPTA
jgi:hypothetical protein